MTSLGALDVGYEFAQGRKSPLFKPDAENIIVWHHRILEAYHSPDFDEERSVIRTVSLLRHGSYEVRLVELPRKLQTATEHLWLELFDHDHQRTIDSYGGRTLVNITAAAKSLCSNAKDLNQTDYGAAS
jgi:hypothetical protein